jgi:hypothetical protein
VPNKRTLILILLSMALGVLVWLDNRPASGPPRRASLPRGEQQPASGAGIGQPPEPAAEADAAKAAGLEIGNPLASFDKEALLDTVTRPLFAPSRRRPPAAAAQTAPAIRQLAPQPEPPSYDLLGIARDGDRAIALLRKKSDGTNFRVEVGDMIGGWRVAKMQPTSVILEREDGTSQTVGLLRE